MKKIILTALAVMLTVSQADAQLLKNLFNSKSTSDVLSTITNTVAETVTVTDLNGTWTYTGSAVSLSGDNTLSNLAASAAESTITQKIDSELEKIGVKPGAVTLAFGTDSTFTCAIGNHTIPGKWSQDNKDLKLIFSAAGMVNIMTFNGTVSNTAQGCSIVFDSDKFLVIIKNILAAMGNSSESSTVTAISALLENYDELKLGANLKKD